MSLQFPSDFLMLTFCYLLLSTFHRLVPKVSTFRSPSGIQVSPSKRGGGSISIPRLTSRPSTGSVDAKGVLAKEFFVAPSGLAQD